MISVKRIITLCTFYFVLGTVSQKKGTDRQTVLCCALEAYRLRNKDVSLRDPAISLLYYVQFSVECEIYQFRWKHNAMYRQ